MRSSKRLLVGIVSALSLCAGGANATYYYLLPTSGLPHVQAATAVNTLYSNLSSYLKVKDGRILYMTSPSSGSVSQTWDTPIPIDDTDATWYATARGYIQDTGASDDLLSRICTFNQDGSFYGCGSSVTYDVQSSAYVPPGGTAYNQTTLTSKYFGVGGVLVGFKVHN